MWISIVLFIFGFILLIKGADFLVNGSSALAKRTKVSGLVVGLTLVAFGTSLPELVINVTASFHGMQDVVIGNILGSNITNMLLILGLSSLISPLRLKKDTTWKEIPYSFLAGALVLFLMNSYLLDMVDFAGLSIGDGLILLLFFIIFLFYIFYLSKKDMTAEDKPAHQKKEISGLLSLRRAIFYVVAGLAGLVIGGSWIVNGVTALATALGASTSLIALTIVALGTSLPELATSAVAVWKKNFDIAVGNIIGSNIFNIFFILGISVIIAPIPFSSIVNRDILMVMVASLLLFLFMFTGRRHILQRWQGGLFVLLYVAYVYFLILCD